MLVVLSVLMICKRLVLVRDMSYRGLFTFKLIVGTIIIGQVKDILYRIFTFKLIHFQNSLVNGYHQYHCHFQHDGNGEEISQVKWSDKFSRFRLLFDYII